jgi:hypothetical protein
LGFPYVDSSITTITKSLLILLISEGELLLANATIISGILLYLTFALIFKRKIVEMVEKKKIVGVLVFILLMLITSTLVLLKPAEPWVPSFLIARLLSLGAIACLIGIYMWLRK